MYLWERALACAVFFYTLHAQTCTHKKKKKSPESLSPKWFSLILNLFIFCPRFLLFLNIFSMSLSTQGEEIFLDMFEDEYRSMTVG